MQRKGNTFYGFYLNIAFVQLHDLLGQAQANAGTIFVRGRKGNKNTLDNFFRDAAAVVGYLHRNSIIFRFARYQFNGGVGAA